MSLNVRKKRPYTDLNYDFLFKGIDVSAVSFHKVIQVAFKLDAMNNFGSILGLIFWFQATIIFILVSIFSSKSSFLNRSYTLKSKTYVLEILIYIFFAVWILKP